MDVAHAGRRGAEVQAWVVVLPRSQAPRVQDPWTPQAVDPCRCVDRVSTYISSLCLAHDSTNRIAPPVGGPARTIGFRGTWQAPISVILVVPDSVGSTASRSSSLAVHSSTLLTAAAMQLMQARLAVRRYRATAPHGREGESPSYAFLRAVVSGRRMLWSRWADRLQPVGLEQTRGETCD